MKNKANQKTMTIRRVKKLIKEKNKMNSEIIEIENKNRIASEKMELLISLRETISDELSNNMYKNTHKITKKLNVKQSKNEHAIYNTQKLIADNKNKIENKKIIIKRMETSIKQLDRELLKQWEVKKYKIANEQTIELILN
ncbi:hypothetical protein [Mycoplasma todarodis]|uniref:Flagellar FliJ protein n=1 Tax=Mycoplasma todarodis TaxID=1937191 RepID=A0A4R0XJ57_9MOLU|nr:hypothetical protein [Mycoplasma todarodis]TCG10444.1 hypothetical protein C4B25_04180 [Mycoplasma todarodis]